MIVYRTTLDGCVLYRPDWGHPTDERAQWRAMAQAIALERGYSPGWVSHQYKAKWGEWPPGSPGKEVAAMPPTDEVRAEIYARIKEYRRAQAKAKRVAKKAKRAT